LEFCNGGGIQKTRVMPIAGGVKSFIMCILLDTKPECDGQTDGVAKTTSRSACVHYHADARDKKAITKS